jgi:hypothetical protein
MVMSGVGCSAEIGENGANAGKTRGTRDTTGTGAGGSNGGGAGTTSGTGTGAGGSGTGTTTGTGTGAGGTAGNGGTGSGGAGGSSGGSGGAGGSGGVTPPPTFEPASARTIVRKVKGLLTGQPPVDSDIATITNNGASGLQGLIASWTMTPDFRDRMLFLFRNTFQQTGFIATEDFKPQLLENGGLDLGPVGAIAVGDDAYTRIVQNLQDSFARTAWQIISDGRPFSDVLTTRKFMMTTALKSLYLQIEMPNDQPLRFNFNQKKLQWKVDYSGTPIPLEDSLNPASPNYMVFSDEAPVNKPAFPTGLVTCQNTPGKILPMEGYALLFQRLFGMTPRSSYITMTPECFEHASKPYFTAQDTNDWQWVNLRSLGTGEAYVQPYDLPKLRTATEIALALPRVGFYTTPSYLALWNTNDSNQHRVTANQTLLVALGQSFTGADTITPISTTGLDSSHSVNGTECYGCHKSLDPLRKFWGTQNDYNDRNDFLTAGFGMVPANPRPTTKGGALAFGNVNATGGDMFSLGPLLLQVAEPDGTTRFAMSMTQQLCFYANSAMCLESDPEFRRIAHAFQNANYDFRSLVADFFSSPLVTATTTTTTTAQNGVTVSIARRDQLCANLSTRLAMPDLCAQAVPLPSITQAATARIASSLASDGFSRGEEYPVTPSSPTLFYRAASELLCENIAIQVVDALGATSSLYKSASYAAAIDDMTSRVMGLPASDPRHADAVSILTSHYNAGIAAKNTATNSLRSAFVLACESPTSLSFGL